MINEKCHTSPTICWKCAKAVPNRDHTRGCEWSLHFEPVPGWEIKVTPAKHYGDIKSYCVHKCPKFIKG